MMCTWLNEPVDNEPIIVLVPVPMPFDLRDAARSFFERIRAALLRRMGESG